MEVLKGASLFRVGDASKGRPVAMGDVMDGDGGGGGGGGGGDRGFICFYFAARFCPPCRTFTPLFRKFYDVRETA